MPDAELEAYPLPVWSGKQALTPIYREKIDGTQEQIAEGYERTELLSAVVDEEKINWVERRLVIRFLQQARIAEAGLRTRINNAKKMSEV